MVQDNDDYRHGHNIRERALQFAIRIVAFCERLIEMGGVAKMMAPQLLNCGTSVYAMLEEARAAESRKDFISKCSIGLKEIRESHGRLRVHIACRIGPLDEASALKAEANELVSIITRIVGNTRTNSRPDELPRSKKTRAFEKRIPNS